MPPLSLASLTASSAHLTWSRASARERAGQRGWKADADRFVRGAAEPRHGEQGRACGETGERGAAGYFQGRTGLGHDFLQLIFF